MTMLWALVIALIIHAVASEFGRHVQNRYISGRLDEVQKKASEARDQVAGAVDEFERVERVERTIDEVIQHVRDIIQMVKPNGE